MQILELTLVSRYAPGAKSAATKETLRLLGGWDLLLTHRVRLEPQRQRSTGLQSKGQRVGFLVGESTLDHPGLADSPFERGGRKNLPAEDHGQVPPTVALAGRTIRGGQLAKPFAPF